MVSDCLRVALLQVHIISSNFTSNRLIARTPLSTVALGGAAWIQHRASTTSVVITRCLFRDNSALLSGGGGGGGRGGLGRGGRAVGAGAHHRHRQLHLFEQSGALAGREFSRPVPRHGRGVGGVRSFGHQFHAGPSQHRHPRTSASSLSGGFGGGGYTAMGAFRRGGCW
jgi:hypothetical protein